MIRRHITASLLPVLVFLSAQSLSAEPAAVLAGDRAQIEFAAGLPSRWLACEPACAAAGSRQREFLSPQAGGRIAWHAPKSPALVAELETAVYDVDRDGNSLTLRSLEPVGGRLRSHRYSLDPVSGALTAELDLPAGVGLQLSTGESFIPQPLPGFGALYGDVRAVLVGPDGQQQLGDEDIGWQATLDQQNWAAIRSRFWTLALQSDNGATPITASLSAENQPAVAVELKTGTTLRFYAGPIEWQRLGQVDTSLREMLFAALWDWLRWLCLGLLLLLGFLQGLVGSPGLAIILLSLSVKILMYPLTRVADRWQAQVNRTQALLQPSIDAIKRKFKGEEAHNLILALYKEHDVHPMYSLRSLAGFLIQIPIFIAAFDMLGENFLLHQAAFLWVDDLARPDHIASLPMVLPFFGGYLNLLPFLMTGITLLASAVQAEPDLTPQLRRQQQIKLYLMAAAFFVLFYTFPAGMVLYWATNNLLHLLKILPAAFLGARPDDAE